MSGMIMTTMMNMTIIVIAGETGLRPTGDGATMIRIGTGTIGTIRTMIISGTGRCLLNGVQVALNQVNIVVRMLSDERGARICECPEARPVIAGDGDDGRNLKFNVRTALSP